MSGANGRGASRRGFTVIEVMVAVMLLSVAVVSIFGAQFAAIASVEYSRDVTHAIELARCRMSELELQFKVDDGFEEGDVLDEGVCCEAVEGETDAERFTCRWEIKTIQLPDVSQMMDQPDAGLMDDGMDMLGDMTGGEDQGDDMLGGFGMGGMASSLMPMVSGVIEQAIRRVTVVVEWRQGSEIKDIDVVQYVVHPTQGPLQLLQQAQAMEQMADEAMTGGGVLPGGMRGGER
ncbi:MAG: prepilin-type N-terminal cleavage/methylation domain-containing protein [Polyangia bacterium]